MATVREPLEPTKPWEVLATLFGYFAIAKDIPDIFRTLSITKLVPQQLKTMLLQYNASSDFWLMVFFTVVMIILWLWLMPRKKEIKEKEKEDIIRELSKSFRRKQIIRIIRSFGLVLLREVFLSLFHVESYGTFRRPPPPDWPLAPDRLESIDRIGYADGRGIEFQYSADFSNLIIREHPRDSDRFSDPIIRPPSWPDVKLLMLASNIFPFWFLVYLIKRPLVCLRRLSCRAPKSP